MKPGTICSITAVLLALGTCNISADEPTSAGPQKPCPSASARDVLVIAHRGAHTQAPENTLAAFRKAIELGCDFVEMDIRQTKDGALVIMHDATVDRTTNGAGKVEDMTLSRIRDLDVGMNRGKEWAGEKVPTFDDALALCRGKIKVYVHNKCGSPAKVMAAIERNQMLNDVVMYGAGADGRQEFKRLRPEVRVVCDLPESADAISQLINDVEPEILNGHLSIWSREKARAVHRMGAQVWMHTLGSLDVADSYRQALDRGADAIQTDHPEALLKLLKNRGPRTQEK